MNTTKPQIQFFASTDDQAQLKVAREGYCLVEPGKDVGVVRSVLLAQT